jgi:hypothetical protein
MRSEYVVNLQYVYTLILGIQLSSHGGCDEFRFPLSKLPETVAVLLTDVCLSLHVSLRELENSVVPFRLFVWLIRIIKLLSNGEQRWSV